MSATATVHDFTPGAFRSKLARHNTTPQPATETIFSDMADGILALDFGLTFAGFEYEGRQLILSIAGLLGDSNDEVAMFDDQLADHIKSSVRTVRRWRAAYLRQAEEKNFGFIEITEGEYLSDEKRYAATRYRINSDAKAYVEKTVEEARRSGYGRGDRRAAIEKSSETYYEELPGAPVRRRDSKPRQSQSHKIERDFINAKNNLTKGRNGLDSLPERARTVFLAGKQGAELRELLLALQQQVQDILQDFPQTVDDVEVKEVPANLAGIPPPPVSGTSDAAEDESARTPPYQATSPAEDESGTSDAAEEKNPSTCVRPSSSYTRTQDSEAAAIFERFDERLRQPRATEPPKISKVEIEIVADVEIEERKASFSEELFKPPDDNSDENH